MWVTDSRMLCSLPRSCLVHPVDRFDSEGWFSSDQVIFLTVFCVFWWKNHAAFKWKDAISGFPVSPGTAEALVRWGGKIKYLLIAYFLGNIYVKNCRNRTVYVKTIARCKGGTFFWDRVYKGIGNCAIYLIVANRIVMTLHVNRIGHEHENGQGPMSIAAFWLKLHVKMLPYKRTLEVCLMDIQFKMDQNRNLVCKQK